VCRGVDTACQPKHYYEAGVGNALDRAIRDGIVTRDQVFLQTKFTPIRGKRIRHMRRRCVSASCATLEFTSNMALGHACWHFAGQDPKNIPYDSHAPIAEQVKQSFETSLKNLQTNYVNSLLLHSPMDSHKDTMYVCMHAFLYGD
jgi:diketogulonate reductase-like aldo/keto reductase